MNFQLIYSLVAAMFLLVFSPSCDSGFEEMNVNPNQPTDVSQSSLFTHAQRIPFGWQRVVSEAWEHNYLWTQHISKRDVNTDIYFRQQFEAKNPQDYWDRFYTIETPNLSDLLRRLETEPEDVKRTHVNRKAMVNIVLAYLAHQYTDLYGGMPYSKAFMAFDFDNQNFTPEYDTQEQIYNTILEQLKSASDELTEDASQDNFAADIWFNGDISKWKRFANSLRLRLAMRISKVDEQKARSIIDELLKNPDDLMTSNDDNLIFKFGNFENQGVFTVGTRRNTGRAAAKNLVDFLTAAGDPRLRIFFSKTTEGVSPGTIVGIPVSPDARDEADLFIDDSSNEYTGKYSLLQPNAWANKKFPETVMTYAEVLLLRAEIAAKGWSTENAEQLYNEGIRASIKYYSQLYEKGMAEGGFPANPDFKVTDREIDDLLATPAVKYNPDDAENQIGIQQWIHHHRNSKELLSNFRRSDIPNATSTPVFETLMYEGVEIPRKDIPKRFSYPDSEFSLNEENVTKMVDIQGPNNETTRLWWDVD